MNLSAVGVGEGDGFFGVTADVKTAVVGFVMGSVAEVDHFGHARDTVRPVVEQMVCLGFA